MKIAIFNPAPKDGLLIQWGDYHFGNSLSHFLETNGHVVRNVYWPDWSEDVSADLLIALRGMRKVDAIGGRFKRRCVWIISHPGDVARKELASFEHVFCAADSHAEALSEAGISATPLLQCTDPRRFYSRKRNPDEFRYPFVFVANTRNSHRPIADLAVAANLPLRIWGNGWTEPEYARSLVSDFLPNERLGSVYRSAFCSLNDSWPDMARFGYINNRVFDALACGLPVLSTQTEGLEQLNFSGLRLLNEQEPFQDQIDDFLIDYESLQEAAYEDAMTILAEHTFAHRAGQILGRIFS